MRSIYVPAVSLMALRQMHRSAFYPQDWYVGHRFVRDAIPAARFELDDGAPAVAWVWAFFEALDRGEPFELWTLTGSHDDAGDRVYLRATDRGVEIHRHLKDFPPSRTL